MMKAVVAALGGCVLSLGMFGGGAAVAAWFIAVEPGPAKTLGEESPRAWTLEPRRVDPANQDFERVPGPAVVAASAPAAVPTNAAENAPPAEPAVQQIDTMQTSSVFDPPATLAGQDTPELNAAHVDWCADRYRSYRPRDNSYTPYSGGRRECVSPFPVWADGASAEPADAFSPTPDDGDGFVSPAPAEGDGFVEVGYVTAEADGYAADIGMAMDPEHVAYCFSRYRSYRPADNSYQPYGGGPRQQCH